jgi:RNA polymerase sigma-54 factor
MTLSAKLAMRQGQTMVLTPQLLQAIKLLQMPSGELTSFIETELERNPLLERAEERFEGEPAAEIAVATEATEGDWASENLVVGAEALSHDLGTEISNTFDADRPATVTEHAAQGDGPGLSLGNWPGASGGGGGGGGGDQDAADIEAYVASQESFSEFLTRQAMVAVVDPGDRLIAAALIDGLDEAGYFRGDLGEIAEQLGAHIDRVERLLTILQTLEPTGVFARDLAECLSLQLIERDRFDPAMQALVANLTKLAQRDWPALRRLCGVDQEDLVDMVAEIKCLDPKPGRAFAAGPEALAIPDVIVSAAQNSGWRVELNAEALPRVLVNESYAAVIKRGAGRDEDRQYISTQLQSAHWLTKSLEQRARTILNVASEIVRRQDGFLVEGVSGLRPLNLKTVADAIGVHESTVSRATSNKYVSTPRGLFEMKYFFTASLPSGGAGEAHSAEAVRYKIRQMIDSEDPRKVLSDDDIVTKLREADIVVARRTVAKYRDNLRIPSSMDRRRQKLGGAAFASG